MYLSWIIPTFNEEKRIEKTIREVDAYLNKKQFSGGYEIIVSDSSSKDRTQEIVLMLRKEMPNLRFINTGKRGKGLGVRTGMLNATGELRIFSDADNSTAPEYFDAMVPLFENGYDVVISSRNAKDAAGAARDVKEPFIREMLGTLGNILIQIIGVWGIWDTQNGFKACTAKSAEEIFRRIRMHGFSFDIEMLAIARRLHFRIAVIPVRWRFDEKSTVTPGAYVRVLLDVFHIRWNLLTRAYK